MLDFQIRVREEGQVTPKSQSRKGLRVTGPKSSVGLQVQVAVLRELL